MNPITGELRSWAADDPPDEDGEPDAGALWCWCLKRPDDGRWCCCCMAYGRYSWLERSQWEEDCPGKEFGWHG